MPPRFATLATHAAHSLLIALLAATVPRVWCGRDAHAWLTDDLASEQPLADRVATRAIRGVGPTDLHTGSANFDGEWALVTNQMTALGLGQVMLAHPSERARYLPALRAAIGSVLTPAARAFGTIAWSEDGFASLASDHGHAYLGYLDMALGMQRLLDATMDPARIALHDALTAALARRLSRAPHAMIETYPGVTFPADVASVVGAIALHGLASGDDHRALLASWAQTFRRDAIDRETGFVYQTLDPMTGAPTSTARGSGTALIAYFVSFADVALARDLDRAIATRGRSSLLGFGGVREYPSSHAVGHGDVDSGPVVLGVSVSASGFALGTAHMFRDEPRFTELFRTAYLFGAPTGGGYLLGDGLGDAILLAMMTSRDDLAAHRERR